MDITITIGGEAGQGIQTVGQLLATVCRNAGLYVFGINDFESRIRGGHSFYQLRVSERRIRAAHHSVNLLIALDEATLKLHRDQLAPAALCLLNSETSTQDGPVRPLAFAKLAQQAGAARAANTVAAAAGLCLLGAPLSMLENVLEQQFSKKGAAVLDENITAARLGYGAVRDLDFSFKFNWQNDSPRRMLMEGAASLSLGALAGDCRFAAFYPMSPATSIMMNLAAWQDRFPVVVEQAEDEISAANMIIGASFAGVRALTATSGGGFCLMTEAVGLAGITETPIVVINAQRPGPATGLATRTAQPDLRFVIHAGQDEFPRFVFAPGSPEQAYEVAARAFDLADKYQVPAILLVDQYFNDSLFVLDHDLEAPAAVMHHIAADCDMENPAHYQRYSFTDSGISPRAVPCAGQALVMVCGNEHKPDGHSTEDKTLRTAMVDKRSKKIESMLRDMRPPTIQSPDARIRIICWGSTFGAVEEAVELLRTRGVDAGLVHFCDIWPFPIAAAITALAGAERLICVEQNSTAQLAGLIRQETGIAVTQRVLKYDGRPLYPEEIVDAVKKAGA
jgi:2-oxoglutarate/2-oxoacid ferredoxin oxidoreductase subunit alpha